MVKFKEKTEVFVKGKIGTIGEVEEEKHRYLLYRYEEKECLALSFKEAHAKVEGSREFSVGQPMKQAINEQEPKIEFGFIRSRDFYVNLFKVYRVEENEKDHTKSDVFIIGRKQSVIVDMELEELKKHIYDLEMKRYHTKGDE